MLISSSHDKTPLIELSKEISESLLSIAGLYDFSTSFTTFNEFVYLKNLRHLSLFTNFTGKSSRSYAERLSRVPSEICFLFYIFMLCFYDLILLNLENAHHFNSFTEKLGLNLVLQLLVD